MEAVTLRLDQPCQFMCLLCPLIPWVSLTVGFVLLIGD